MPAKHVTIGWDPRWQLTASATRLIRRCPGTITRRAATVSPEGDSLDHAEPGATGLAGRGIYRPDFLAGSTGGTAGAAVFPFFLRGRRNSEIVSSLCCCSGESWFLI